MVSFRGETRGIYLELYSRTDVPMSQLHTPVKALGTICAHA